MLTVHLLPQVVSLPDRAARHGGVVQYDYGKLLQDQEFVQNGVLNPPTEILKAAAARVTPGDRNDHLLLPPEVDEAGPYELPMPREVTGIETYIPAFIMAPSLRKLAESYQAMNAAQQAATAAGGAKEDDDEVPDVVENFDEAEAGKKEEPEVGRRDRETALSCREGRGKQSHTGS